MRQPKSPIPRSDDFRTWLRYSAKVLGVSYYTISRSAGVGVNKVGDFAKGTHGMNLDTASKVALVVKALAKDKGISLPEPADIGEVRI